MVEEIDCVFEASSEQVTLGAFDFATALLDRGSHGGAQAPGDLAVGNTLHLEGMEPAKIGDLLEGQGGIVHQPHGGGLGHQDRIGH